jgi:glucosamine-6-phosphate deaminase
VRIRVFSTPEALARSLALEVEHLISAHPTTVLGLPTGRTPVRFYQQLVSRYRTNHVDFSAVSTFNLDEFLDVPAQHPGSYHAYMRRHLFDHVNVDRRRARMLSGQPRDAVLECERYERAIKKAGGLDLLILGLGSNGHIGFNEPARALEARTHRTTLRYQTRRANAGLFGGRVSAVPREGLSMGMGTILGARRIVLLATGASKSSSVERMIRGPVTTKLPASFLQLHPATEIWLDRAAAWRVQGVATRSAAPASDALRRPRRSRL